MDVATAVALVPVALSIVQGIEKAFEDYQGSGAVKKIVAVDMLTSLFNGFSQAASGGAKATTDELRPVLGSLVEFAVSIMNAGSKLVTGKDVIVPDASATAAG